MKVRYREFVFPPYPGAKPCVVGCIVDWGEGEWEDTLGFRYFFLAWLDPLVRYLSQRIKALNVGLDNLEQGLGVYAGKGYWLEVKEREGEDEEALRLWFCKNYMHGEPMMKRLFPEEPPARWQLSQMRSSAVESASQPAAATPVLREGSAGYTLEGEKYSDSH